MSRPLRRVWLLTDQKPGHRNQLRGLLQRLQQLAEFEPVWIDASQYRLNLWQVLRGFNAAPDLSPPDLVIAAGSGTHRLLLATRRQFGCFSTLLMKPAFPLGWLDALIIPAHDNPPTRANVFISQGALNAIAPLDTIPPVKRGLILIGGESKHFGWDTDAVVQQVVRLVQERPDWRWTLTDSRRTPATLMQALKAAELANLDLHPHGQTAPEWLPQQFGQHSQVWVTPDSVSMVYEALTAGLPTGLFKLPAAAKPGRVARGLEQLLHQHLVIPFEQRQSLTETAHRPRLWEADRAARWLYQRYQSLSR